MFGIHDFLIEPNYVCLPAPNTFILLYLHTTVIGHFCESRQLPTLFRRLNIMFDEGSVPSCHSFVVNTFITLLSCFV